MTADIFVDVRDDDVAAAEDIRDSIVNWVHENFPNLEVERFPVEGASSLGLTVSTPSANVPGPNEFFDQEDSPDEAAAASLFRECFPAEYPGLVLA